MSSNTAPEAARPHRTAARSPWRTWALLAAVLLVGGYFRTLNLTGWDGTSYLHPDERFIIFTANNLRVPKTFADYLRSDCVVDGAIPAASNPTETLDRQEPTVASGCNTLNPRNYNWSRFFVYGTLPTTITRVVVEGLQQLQPPEERGVSPDDVRNLGRLLSTLFDLGSVVMVFLIGRRLYGERAGLLAALLYACAALPIQLAHFFTVDSATGFFVLLAVFWSVRAMQGGGVGSFAALGLSIGTAMACRFTMATLGLLAMVAVAARYFYPDAAMARHGDEAPVQRAAGRSPRRLASLLALLALSGGLTLLTWRVLQPDAFVGTSFFDIRPEPRFLKNVQEIGGMISGEVDFPPSQQWASRTRYLFSWQNMVVWGLGLPLGLAAWAAWAAAGWQLLRRRHLAHAVPWVWVGFYFAWQGGQFVMTMRYYALLYGLMAIFAAWGLLALVSAAGAASAARPRAARPWSAAHITRALLLLVAVGTALWAYAFTRIYTEPHSRIQASRWIYQNIPPGSAITFEEWDDPLPLGIDGQDSGQYVGVKTMPYWEDDPVKYFGYVDGSGNYQLGLLDQLDQADYLIFSSNRVYDSATRLRMRYPALTRYYNALFTGDLGFELAADIHSYPTLFGIELPSPVQAEEAFSVYDHPRVLIFKKTAAYSRERAEALITGGVAWGEVYKIPTIKASKVPTALRLTDAQWPAYRDAGTWSSLFAPGIVAGAAPWLAWLLALEALGLACFALLFRLLPWLPDRGFALAKTLGLLLAAYLAWLLASVGAGDGRPLVAFGPGGVWLSAALLIIPGALAAWWGRAGLLAFWRARRGALIAAEALFLVAFLGFALLRALNPDLWHPARGGEKPMDLAFLTAVLKSPAFPPYDPWFAGGYINYYYFGFVLLGVLVHMTGIAPGIAYNLAVPTVFALTALGAWGVAYNLFAPRLRADRAAGRPGDGMTAGASSPHPAAARSPRRARRERLAISAGVAAALLALLAGNLANAMWLLPGSAKTDDPGMPPECQVAASYAAQNECRGRTEWAFWDATRIVGTANGDGTINEFPLFTFLYGDLHAHMVALPLTLAALGLIGALVRRRDGPRARYQGRVQVGGLWSYAGSPWSLAPVALLALVAGALRATNTWDYPTALGLGVLGIALAAWGAYRRGLPAVAAAARAAVGAAALVLLSTILFAPFTSRFATDYAGFELWHGARTPMPEFLQINGLWLFLLVTAALVFMVRAGRLRPLWAAAVGLALLALAIGPALVGMDALLLQLALVAAGVAALLDLALRGPGAALPAPAPEDDGDDGGPMQLRLPLDEPAPRRALPAGRPAASLPTILAGLWAVCAVGITLLTEVVAAKGDIGRMNSVFKFGMQSWLLFAVLSGLALVWLWSLGAGGRRSLGASPRGTIAQSPLLAWAWRIPAALLLAGALAYPLTAVPARLADRFDTGIGPTLDGEAFMRSPKSSWGENGQQFTLAQDADAIDWVRRNVQGTPIILEAHAEAYRWAGRFSVYTGLPTILGWPWHMTQQRAVADGGTIVNNRQGLVRQIYDGTDPQEALRLLRLYGVEYVVVGQLEHALYSPQGLAKFEQLAAQGDVTTAYSAEQTSIYRVPPADQPPAVVQTAMPVVPPTIPGKDLMLSVPVDMLPAVDEYAWNALAQSQPVAVLLWLLAWYGLAALGLPLASLVFGRRDRRPAAPDVPPATAEHGDSVAAGEAAPVAARSRWPALQLWDDAGWAWGRLIGLLLLGYAVWLPVSARLWQYDRWGLLIGVLLVLALNAALLARTGGVGALAARLAARRRQVAQSEALFLLAFLFMLGVRALNPDLWHPIWGGEKPFEFGFLNAALRSPVMPPYNPFFSGGVINYYYYGFFLVSLPVKAVGAAPAVAFNLIVPTLFALLLTASFAFAARIARSARVGLLAALLVGVVGNLAGALGISWLGHGGLGQARETLAAGLDGFGERLGDWFMGASRVVPNTINEFPYFSFLFADLHPHMIALPITVLMAALCYELFDQARHAADDTPLAAEGAGGWWPAAGRWSLAALALGALAVTNSWDFPTYGLLLGGALLGRAWRAPATSGWERAANMLGAAAGALAAGAAAIVLYAPFFQSYQAFVTGVGLVHNTTPVADYLVLYGLFLAVLLPAVFGAAWRLLRAMERGARRPSEAAVGFVAGAPRALGAAGGLRAALAAAAALVVLIAVAQPALGSPPEPQPGLLSGLLASVLGLRLWLAALILVAGGVLLSRRIGAAAWFGTWLAVVGWAVSLLFELLFVRDHLAGGEWYRMNTVFKFGLQAWVLLALAAALALPRLWRGLGRWHPAAQAAGAAVLGLLLALGLVYPLVGTPSRVGLRFPEATPPTLDGLAFLETATFPPPAYADDEASPGALIALRSDGEAIRWLNDHIRGTPVVLQSSLEFYRAYGIRVAANTGLPTVVSPLHESEQRDGEQVAQRDRDVAAIYGTTDEDEALELLSRYRVGYVYLGPVERNAYGARGALKWDALTQPNQSRPAYLSQVYANDEVRIYQVDEKVWALPKLPPVDPPAPVVPRPQPEPAPLGEPPAQDPAPVVRDAPPPEDLAALEQLVAADPTVAGPAFALGQRYRDLGRLDDAAAVLAVAAAANPTDVGLHHMWGDVLTDAGRYDDADVALRAAVAVDPSAGNWNKLGVMLIKAGRLDAAEQALQQAVAADAAQPEPYLRLGEVFEARGDAAAAAEQYRRYLAVAPADAPYRRDAEEALARVAP